MPGKPGTWGFGTGTCRRKKSRRVPVHWLESRSGLKNRSLNPKPWTLREKCHRETERERGVGNVCEREREREREGGRER